MKTLKNKNIVRLLILISLIVVVGISFIVTTAVYKGTHTGSGSLVLDKGIYIDISDVSSGELAKNMEMPIQYYPDKVTSEGNRIEFSVSPSSEMEYYIANPTITAQDSSQAFYLRLKLNAQYYVNGSSTPTTLAMSANERNMLFQLFATDSNYSPVLFNDCFAPDANGEYYYYVSGGYGVATKENLAQITSGMELNLFKGFLVDGTTPVSVINFREFDSIPENVTNVTLTLDIEFAIEPNWKLPNVTLLTEDDVTVKLVGDTYEIESINTTATTYALPGYYQGKAITRIGSLSSSPLDDDAVEVWFANTMTHVGGYPTVSTLQRIYLGNNVTEICEWAFYGCSNLSGNLILPISITKINNDAFANLENIDSLFPYLPNCVYFGAGSFKGSSGFNGILSVTGEINGYTVFADVGVKKINIKSGTTSLGGDSAFGNMTNLKEIYIDSSAVAGLASSSSGLLENENLTDVYIKNDLTIGAYFANHSNFVETESTIDGYRHFGRAYQITWNGGSINGTLDAKLWDYAGSAGYTSTNLGNNDKYTFSGKNAVSKVGINGVNSYYLPTPIISGYTFDGWYTTANGVGGGAKVATADGWIANVSGYTSENGTWIRNSATTLYAHYTKKNYTISYDYGGGTKGANSPTSYVFGNTTAISNPTRTGYTFVGWDISVSLGDKTLSTIELSSGVQQFNSSYPNAVYYELFYARNGVSYTAELSGGEIRWRKYTTAGAFGGNVSTSSKYAPTDDMYVALWYHLGNSDSNTTYAFAYTGDDYSIDSLQVGNLTLTAKWTQNSSYLLIADSWKSNLTSSVGGSIANINSILFTHDVSKIPSGVVGVSVGATDISGQTTYSNMKYVSDVTAYAVANGSKYDVIFYSPCPIYAPANSANLFNNLTGLTNIQLSALDTSKVTDMSRMFQNASALTTIDLSLFSTSLSTNFKGMFDGCSSLVSLDLSNFNTSNVTSISGMFKNCSALTSLNISSFNTSKVTGMSQVFMGCTSLQTIDISNFDTSSVTTMNAMFNGCKELTNIKYGSKFTTQNVTIMSSMFESCLKLSSSILNTFLNSFDTTKVTSMSNMFANCETLISVDLHTFDMSNVTNTSGMLTNCNQLRSIRTPFAMSSTSISLPYGSWFDQDDLTVALTQISQSLVASGWKTLRPGYSVTFNAIATTDYSESNLRNEFAKHNSIIYDDYGCFTGLRESMESIYPDLTTYSSINYAYIQILPKVTSRWVNSSTGVISAETYVLGNAKYSVRVPRGYYLEIKQIDYQNKELSESWTLGKEYVSGDSDFETQITTNSKTNKLVFTLRHSTKSLKPSAIETSALANLRLTLESSIVANVWYGQDIPMVSSYSPGMDFHDTIKLMSGVTSSKEEFDQTFVKFDKASSLGEINHIVAYSPTIYTIKLNTGNGKYNGQNGTITIGTGYMGQKIDLKRSLITLPIGNLLKSITQSGKGQFVDIGAYGNELFSRFDEWQYQVGAGDATLTLKYTPATYEVSFDANGGSVSPSTSSVTYGSGYGELPTPSKTGYTFAGWLGGSKNLLKGSVSQYGWSGEYSLLNANTNKFSFRVHTGGSTGSCWRSFYIDVSKYVGQTITISGTITAINPSNGEVSYINVGQGNKSDYPYHIAGSSDSKRIYNGGDAVGTTFSHTCTIIDGTSIMGICIWANITAQNGYVDVVFDNLQIEAGSKATAFENPNVVITADSKVTLPYNHTLTAKWTPKTFAVTFDSLLNLGTGVVDSSTWSVSNGEYVMTSSGGNGGYLSGFHNYMTNGMKYRITIQAKASKSITLSMNYEAGASKSISLTSSYQTFYVDFTYNSSATYKALTFYSSNWASGDKLYVKDVKLSKLVNYDSTYGTLPTPTTYSKTGYIVSFEGWYTAASGGNQVTASTSVKLSANQTLYAHWKETPITYTIVYNGNGYTSGSTASSSHTYDSAKNLTANGFAKTGYTFAGWNTKSDGTGTSYANSASVTNLTATNNATVTLYAKWTAKQITVSFNPSQKGGLITDVADGTYTGNNATITYTSSSHQYKFVNSSTSDPHVTIASTVYLESGKTYTIHAKMRNTSGSVISGSIQIFYAINEAYSEANSRRLSGGEGSTTLTVSSTGTYNIRIDNDYGKDIVIYEFYIIEGDFTTSKTVTYDSTYGTLPTPLREGYTFAGWYTLSSGGSQITASTKVTNANDYTLFAHWTENTKAYLMTGSNWQAAISKNNYDIESIEFTKTKPTSGTRVSVGATNPEGTTAYVPGTSGVSDVTAYVTESSTSGKYKIVFYSNATIYAPVDSSYLFSNSSLLKRFTSLNSIKFNNFNTSNVTNMNSMFRFSEVTSLDLSGFDTSKVTDMGYMFTFCTSLSSITLTSFNTSNVTNMACMFNSTEITSLDLSNFDMSKTTKVDSMLSILTEQFDFYSLITPKKINTAIELPFSFCLASNYSGEYTTIPTSLTSTRLLPKYVQVTLNNFGDWSRGSITTNCSGLNDGATVTVSRGTYIEFYLKTQGITGNATFVYMSFNQLDEKPTSSNLSGGYYKFGVYNRDGINVNSLIEDEKLTIGITDERTNVEEIDIKNDFVMDINKDEIAPMWFTVANYWCQLVAKTTLFNTCSVTVKIRVTNNQTYVKGRAGEGYGFRTIQD